MTAIKPIRYYGGKAYQKNGGWISDRIPWAPNTCYVESHAGMLGILLSRPKSTTEIANDLNSRLVNWWSVMRDPATRSKLTDMMRYTPHSRDVFTDCYNTIDEGDSLTRAWKFMVAVTQSLKATDNDASWAWTLHSGSHRTFRYEDRLDAIGRRVESVQLDNRPAVEVMERMADSPSVIMYCDPPYANTSNRSYTEVRFDRDRTLDALRQQRGRVAISGYGAEWDDLGWERHERVKPIGSFTEGNAGGEVTEVLWTNYGATVQGSLV